MRLPTELVDHIALYTQDVIVSDTLKPWMSQYAYDLMNKNILVYGSVQSGKTAEIINILQTPEYMDVCKVLVVQNSLLILKQYQERLRSHAIDHQVIDKDTTAITSNVVLVMNNTHRYKALMKHHLEKFILILDEADQTYRTCPLKAYKTYHITATPMYHKKHTVKFDRIIQIPLSPKYHGLDSLHVKEFNTYSDVFEDLFTTNSGMLLISEPSSIADMTHHAISTSTMYPECPIVLLTANKILYVEGRPVQRFRCSITQIIDTLQHFPHIIFIAYRLSSRGLSYTSSDHRRHLTHQLIRCQSSYVSFMQRMRILGIYNTSCPLTLYVDSERAFRKHYQFHKTFDPHALCHSTTETS